jgi:hypothetical protein
MRRSIVCCLLLSLAGSSLAVTGIKPALSERRDDALQVFWQKFKTAVIDGRRETVSSLSKFPVRMSYGIRSIKNQAEFRRRYREVFNAQSDAARCFARKEPEVDAANRGRFEVACPNEAGDEVVIYKFELTKTGWKFVALDNLNE